MALLTWICPRCGKEIISLYAAQLRYNRHQHRLTHEKKKKTPKEDLAGNERKADQAAKPQTILNEAEVVNHGC